MSRVENRGYLCRRRWTEADATQALAAFEKSGLGPSAFARRTGVDPQRLARWRRRLGSPSGVVFTEVVRATLNSNAGSAAGVFEIVFASGRVVRVPALFDDDALRRLVAVVEETAC